MLVYLYMSELLELEKNSVVFLVNLDCAFLQFPTLPPKEHTASVKFD